MYKYEWDEVFLRGVVEALSGFVVVREVKRHPDRRFPSKKSG